MELASSPSLEAGLYPELPANEMDGVSFCLQKISELQKQLEGEKEARAALYKNYRFAVMPWVGQTLCCWPAQWGWALEARVSCPLL